MNSASTAALTQVQAETVVRCYWSPDQLVQAASDVGKGPDELFADMLPTKNHLKSGDFGEMLSWSDLQTRPPQPRFPVYRWWNRSSRDDTVRGVDLIGYALRQDSPSPDDLLVLCEVKTRTKRRDKKVVEKAYKGVLKDHATRLANQLMFQSKLLIQQNGSAHDREGLARFWSKNVRPYRRRLIGAIVHDSTLWDDSLLDALPVRHEERSNVEVEIHVTCIEELATWIDDVHSSAVRYTGGLGG
jgi:hypothetical protein